jgi:hypothetical protein
MHARVSAAVVLVVVGAAMGCGSSGKSTGTKTPTTNQVLALHLDTLQQNAADSGESDRYRLLSYPIAALAENVTPATISLTVDGSAQTYSAAGLELVGTTAGSSPTVSDSLFVFVAWSDTNATNILLVEGAAPDTIEDIENLAGANDNGSNSATNLSTSLAGNGGNCSTITLPFAASNDLVSGTTCTSAQMNIAFAVSFTATSTNPNTSYSYSQSNLPTARIVLPATGGQLRVPQGLGGALQSLPLQRQLHTK